MSTETKLKAVDLTLADRIIKVLNAMEALGYPMMVTDGKRTDAEQIALYAQGRTKPGLIVTNANGTTEKSEHQLGRAVDCCFVVGGKPSWDIKLPWATYGSLVEFVGLHWGGNFKALSGDLTHAELRKG